MSNKHLPHVVVLPEDDANGDMARGFKLSPELGDPRLFRVLPPAGGWLKVLDCFQDQQVKDMERFPMRLMILLFDFDGDPNRIEIARTRIPKTLADRVFVLGVLRDPETLKSASRRSLESIGEQIARDCRNGNDATWSDPLLLHNAAELARMNKTVRPVLFPVF